MARDWVDWHRSYDRPGSSVAARLEIVVDLVRDAVDRVPPGPVRVLSLCSGDARDLTGALTGHPRAGDVVGAVVELDPQLANAAELQLASIAPGLSVRCADAAEPSAFADVLPVDVLVLVGIFGNITDDDIRHTIGAVPSLCREGATVLWSRHRREPDVTPMIRAALDRAGCNPIRFESPGAGTFAIGADRFDGTVTASQFGRPLFTFRDDLW